MRTIHFGERTKIEIPDGMTIEQLVAMFESGDITIPDDCEFDGGKVQETYELDECFERDEDFQVVDAKTANIIYDNTDVEEW